jgi:predicted ribosome quality control (RQC) complex YloA/Tae2 family protein
MALSPAEIRDVLAELASALIGALIQKIFQPADYAIVLELRKPGQSLALLLSADPETARLHLITNRTPNPAAPPAFCQLLRAHVEGGRIVAIEERESDRLVRLKIVGRQGMRLLVLELTGRNAHLLLLDEDERILGTLRAAYAKSGQVFTPPLPGRWINTEPIQGDSPTAFPVSSSLERRYQQDELQREKTRRRQIRLTKVRKAIKKTTRRLAALDNDLEKAARYRDYARYGELLKARLAQIKKGEDRVVVQDYFDPALTEIVLPLDPAKDAKGNMDDYFKKHRKYLASEREVRPRAHAAEQELQALRAELERLERGDEVPEEHAGSVMPKRRSQTRSPTQRSQGPFRRFVSADGLHILVGRNACENEELTFGLARSHDLWFHAHGAPGSHVVLRLEKGVEPPRESVHDAATLALLYSDLKKSGKGDVIYSQRSHVRRIKGKQPGTVSVTQEKSLFVALDQKRLRRLKDSVLAGPEP